MQFQKFPREPFRKRLTSYTRHAIKRSFAGRTTPFGLRRNDLIIAQSHFSDVLLFSFSVR
jgi:hypothetical protein